MPYWLAGTGEMADAIRRFDWSTTPLGSSKSWSPALRTTVGLMVANRFPMLLWWGADYISIYNDAYIPILGRKHPEALGLPVRQCWSEIWDVLKPLIDRPFGGGASTWMEDFELYIQRSGFVEETHFTVAYSPVPDATTANGIGGVLATVTEISAKVIAERRVAILRDLVADAAQNTAEQTCIVAADLLSRHGKDVPFALLYLVEPSGQQARLAGAAGIEPGDAASPLFISLDPDDPDQVWPLAEVFRSQTAQDVTDVASRFASPPTGPWQEVCNNAVVVPVRSTRATELYGLLVGGISARLRFDRHYRDFYELVASQIGTAIARARAYEEETRRADALAEIDRAKNAFFSNVSHEFRTPLTLMLGPLEELKTALERSSEPLAEVQRERLELVHRNSLRLLKLTNALLDFARIGASRMEAVYEPTDLASYSAELASEFRSAIEAAGLELILDCPRSTEKAYVDRTLWEKIVLNLVSNAFKYTLSGEIEVSLHQRKEHFELSVRDTGAGIPVAELPNLFDRFHRVAGAPGRTHEGAGIGLALVRELVHLHGGEVSVESVLGAGSTFCVAIPLGHGHLPQKQITEERRHVKTPVRARPFLEEALRWLPDGAPGPGEDVSSHAGTDLIDARREGKKKHILLADDNADMRAYLRQLLNADYEVETVGDGEAVLAAIERRIPDLVLADVMMPRLDGLQLVARLRAEPATDTLPVILLSARAGEEARIEGIAAGADDYLVKPFSARELLARVGSTLNLARFRQEATQREIVLREEAEGLHARVRASVAALQESDKRQTFLLRLSDSLRPLDNPLDIQQAAAEMLGEHLGVSRAFFFKAERTEQACEHVAAQDFFSAMAMASLAGRHAQANSGEGLFATLARGEKLVVRNIDDVSVVTARQREMYQRLGIRCFVAIPLVRNGRYLGGFAVLHEASRNWTSAEIALIAETAERTWTRVAHAQADEALRQSENQLSAIFSQATVGLAQTDLDGRFIHVNDKYCEMLGTACEKIIGATIGELTAPEDRPRDLQLFKRAIETDEPYSVEKRYVRPDGSTIWANDAVSAIRGGHDQPQSALIVSVDITDRKDAEEQQQLLVGELNHRVKNTLATVQAIVQHTLRRTHDPAVFVATFAGRIQSLARAHSILGDTAWQSADLRELVGDQLSLGAIDIKRVKIWGPPAHLESQMALHVALMLHELTTNSNKYGALSNASGEVTISWRIQDGKLHLQWLERGGPPVKVPTQRGFGTTLIEQSAKSAGGDAQMAIGSEGIAWQIVLSMPQPIRFISRERLNLMRPQKENGRVSASRQILAGKRFLIVEDEPLVALDIISAIEDAGARVAGQVGTVEGALTAIEGSAFDAVLLDANLRGQPVDDIASALTRRNVPFLFVTGYGRANLPQAFARADVVTKPFSQQQLLDAAAKLVGVNGSVVRLRE